MSKFQIERKEPPRAIPQKEWTFVDLLTHDFMDCAEFRARCLAKHGQYMSHDGRRVLSEWPSA